MKGNKVRAQLMCEKVSTDRYGSAVVTMAASYEEGANKDFTDYTPSASIEMMISKDAPAKEFFEPGKLYFVDFTECINEEE
jgi:hypothetical protein